MKMLFHQAKALLPFLRETLLFLILLSFILLISLPIVHFDMSSPEQPLSYAKALIFVNLGFLALSCYLILKLYELFFPNFKYGAYLAISVYLMHPALMLPRLIALHFEFAPIFFTTFSLYCFVLFCQKGLNQYKWLLFSLVLYVLGVTLKESSLALGPVLLVYLAFFLYEQQGMSAFLKALYSVKKNRELFLFISLVTVSLALYLSLQGSVHTHSLRPQMIYETFKRLFITTWGLKGHSFAPPVWHNVLFPGITRFILGILAAFTLLTTLLVYFNEKLRDYFQLDYKKSLAFLYIACLFFLILPIYWTPGLPWHLDLSLFFLSLLMGFSTEYLCRRLIGSKLLANVFCFFLAFCIGLTAIEVYQLNIQYIARAEGLPLPQHADHIFCLRYGAQGKGNDIMNERS